MKSIRVATAKASTPRRRHTNHLTKARIVIKRRIARRRRTRPAPPRRRRRSTRAAPTTTTKIARKLINTKVPIAHRLKISIPAVIAAQSTKAKTKTETRTGTAATTTRAAPAGPSTEPRTRSGRTGTSTRAPARPTKINHRRRGTTKSRPR